MKNTTHPGTYTCDSQAHDPVRMSYELSARHVDAEVAKGRAVDEVLTEAQRLPGGDYWFDRERLSAFSTGAAASKRWASPIGAYAPDNQPKQADAPKDHVLEVGVGTMLGMVPISFWMGWAVLTTAGLVGLSVMTLMSLYLRHDHSARLYRPY